MAEEIARIIANGGGAEGLITLEVLQRLDSFNTTQNFPSRLLRRNYPYTESVRDFLASFHDNVVQSNYEGLIDWGIVDENAPESVTDRLSAWYNRISADESSIAVCRSFERAMLYQIKQGSTVFQQLSI